jgi:hypothetical protein
MGWDGKSRCYYCSVDLHKILLQEEGREHELWEELECGGAVAAVPPWSFEWHMQGLCMCEGYYVELIGHIEMRIKVYVPDLALCENAVRIL